MLFTDADVITTDDLIVLDPECTKVATAESITIDGYSSIIRHALEEIGNRLMNLYQNYSGYYVSPGMNLAHVAAVNNIGSTSVSRPRMRLNQVVALSPDPSQRHFKHVLEYKSLRLLYRAAFARFSKQTDRYQRKMDFYDGEEKSAWSDLLSVGVPIVLVPLPCPGAIRELGAGTFNAAAVSASGSSSSEAGNTYDVSITWTGADYQTPLVRKNNESAGSAIVTHTVAAKQVLTVSIAALTPPTISPANVGTADGLYTQMAATGWNVYVGLAGETQYLQNATPISVSTTSHTFTDAPVLSGYAIQPGQFPDYNFAYQRVFSRA